MHFALATTLLAVAASAAAQTIHNVTVGDGGLKFNPQNITAAIGDKVSFEFRAKNHTVTQSTFAAPCVPANINGSAGVDSGFMFIPNNTNLQPGQFPTWTITINTDGPLWFHCAQTNVMDHCKAGMVFSINETPEKTFDMFLATAMSFDPSTLGASSSNTTDPAAAPGAAPASGAASASGAAASGAAASGATGAANAGAGAATTGAPSSTNSAEASNQSVTASGASSVVVSRGAAGLLAALSIGAMFI